MTKELQKTHCKVNVVTVRSGWILQKIAERIAAAGNKHFSDISTWQVSHHPRMHGVVNFYCDVQNCFGGPTPTKDIGLFTHIHANDPSTVNPVAFKLDYCFHMADRYIEDFEKLGYPRHKMSQMVPYEAPEGWGCKKPAIGIFQRGKYEGKGFHFMMDFADNPVCKDFEWVFVGNDWEPVIAKMKANGVTADAVPDSMANYPEDYEWWYKRVDRVLIPSKWEGGPIACLEAMSLGTRVLAADVGWCRQMGAEIFKNAADLALKLYRINKLERHFSHNVSKFSYRRCAKQILDVVEDL